MRAGAQYQKWVPACAHQCTAQAVVNHRVNFEACNSNMSGLFKVIQGTTALSGHCRSPENTSWNQNIKTTRVEETDAVSSKFENPWNENISFVKHKTTETHGHIQVL